MQTQSVGGSEERVPLASPAPVTLRVPWLVGASPQSLPLSLYGLLGVSLTRTHVTGFGAHSGNPG